METRYETEIQEIEGEILDLLNRVVRLRFAITRQTTAVSAPDWKTTAQAAGEIGVSETTIWRWALKYGANFDPGDGLEISARMVDMRILRKLRPTTM